VREGLSAAKGRSDVAIRHGKVDFKVVLAKLKSIGLTGPIMIEGPKVGATAEDLRSLGSDERNSPEAKVRSGPSERARASQTTANARANREFLEKAMAAI
jgi:sugar phosphate isomerase/epimerase